MSCVMQVDPLLIFCGVKGVRPFSVVLRDVVAWIWCGLPIMLRFWRAPHTLGHQWWWWWSCQWIHPLMLLSLQCQLPVCLTALVGLNLVGIYPPWVGVCRVTEFQWHNMTFPWGDYLPDQLQLRLLFCTLLVRVPVLKVRGWIGGLVYPLRRCMLMRSARSRGCGSMRHRYLFYWSGCVFTAIWCA